LSSDNQLMQTLSQTQNRAAKEKKTSSIEIQSLWTPLTQLGEQLTLALVIKRKQKETFSNYFLLNFIEINKSEKTRRTIIT
jgi:hypothetical protein